MILKKKTIQTIRYIMHFVGVNFYTSLNTALNYVKFCTFCSLLLLCLIQLVLFQYFNKDEFYNLAYPASYVATTFLGLSNAIYFFVNRARFKYFLDKLDSPVHEYPDEENLQVQFKWPLNRETWVITNSLVFMYECAGFILNGISPFITFVSTRKPSLIYPAWYPWDITPQANFVLTYFSQMIIGSSVLWACYSLQAYMVFVSIELLREFKVLRFALKTIQSRSMAAAQKKLQRNSKKSKDEKSRLYYLYKEAYLQNLIHCVEHHRALIELFKIFKSWFDIYYTAELIGSGLTFALLFYSLLEVKGHEQILCLFGTIVVAVLNLYSRCFIGELFSEINTKMKKTIFYKTNWQNQALHVRKMLLIFQMQVSRPLDLFGISIYQASFYTFTAVARLSYSYLNLIRASIKK